MIVVLCYRVKIIIYDYGSPSVKIWLPHGSLGGGESKYCHIGNSLIIAPVVRFHHFRHFFNQAAFCVSSRGVRASPVLFIVRLKSWTQLKTRKPYILQA